MTDGAHLSNAAWLKDAAIARLLALLDRDGEEARVVGGAVRNAMMELPVGEIDVATTAVPEEIVRRAEAVGFKAKPTGIEHGTITVVIDGQPFEVTTLREDVETFGRKAKVVFGRDWKGIPRDYYAIPFGERYIWGITAGILRNLYDRIYGT